MTLSVRDTLFPGARQLGTDPAPAAVTEAVRHALAEDLDERGDLSSQLLGDQVAAIDVVARAAGTLAGQRCAHATFAQVDPTLELVWNVHDGDALSLGTVVATGRGSLSSLLMAERTALNFLGHLSGVATLTAQFVAAVVGTSTLIVDTRKTTPGLRRLEKAAVRAGGGHNHRSSLSEAVMLKDNHLSVLAIAEGVAAARQRFGDVAVEVECDRLDQVLEALRARPDVIMLDNMGAEQVGECVRAVRAIDPDRQVLIEVSGGVGLHNVGAFARAGADVISVGALTHSAPALDLAFDFKES